MVRLRRRSVWGTARRWNLLLLGSLPHCLLAGPHCLLAGPLTRRLLLGRTGAGLAVRRGLRLLRHRQMFLQGRQRIARELLHIGAAPRLRFVLEFLDVLL